MEKEQKNTPKAEDFIAAGTINVLAMGYRGIELWRQHREPLTINEEKKDDKKEA